MWYTAGIGEGWGIEVRERGMEKKVGLLGRELQAGVLRAGVAEVGEKRICDASQTEDKVDARGRKGVAEKYLEDKAGRVCFHLVHWHTDACGRRPAQHDAGRPTTNVFQFNSRQINNILALLIL